MDGRSQTGITARASVDDYLGQVIKSMRTPGRTREADRIRHVEACDAQTGPIFWHTVPDPLSMKLLQRIRKKNRSMILRRRMELRTGYGVSGGRRMWMPSMPLFQKSMRFILRTDITGGVHPQ